MKKEKVRVISADLDGAQLRRERVKDRFYTRASGTADDGPINEAIDSVGKHSLFIPAAAWERIFGGEA